MISDAVLIALIGGPVVVIMTTVVNRLMSRQNDRMIVMEKATAARRGDLDILRGIIDELQDETTRLRAGVIVRDGQIGSLRAEIVTLCRQVDELRNAP